MSNTKNMLIEVARVLFAKNGKKDVTMNDIAEASKKGRRTLYTYFKNKEEIYCIVIAWVMRFDLCAAALISVYSLNPWLM